MIWAGLPGQAARASTQALSAYWDQVDCAACHQEVVQQFARTRHGRAMEFGGWGKVNCQSCHGDTAAHVQTMDPEQVRNPTKLRLGEVIESCMSGHASGGHQQLWYGSAHDTNNVSCLECHSVHKAKSTEKLLVNRTDAELCFTCHTDIRKAQFQRSTHLFRSEWGTCALPASVAGVVVD